MKIYRALICALLLMLLVCAASAEETLERYAVDGEEFVLMEQNGVLLYLTGKYEEHDGRLYLELVGENGCDHAVGVRFSKGEANGLSLAKNGDFLFWMDAYSFNVHEIRLDADFIAAVNGVDVASTDALTQFAGLETLSFDLELYDDSCFVPQKMFDFGTGLVHFHGTAEQAAGNVTMAELHALAEQKAKEAIGADKYFVRGESLTLFDENGMKLYLTGEYYDYDALYLSARFENNTNMRLYLAYFREDDMYNHYTYTFGSGYAIEPGEVAVGEIILQEPFPEPDKVGLIFLAHDADDPKLETVFRLDAGVLYFGDEQFSAEETAASVGMAEEQTVEQSPEYAQYETLQNGSRGDAVVRLQSKLIELGHLSGSADGIYGKGTAAGVSRFQETVGLGATGVADPVTQAMLFGE